jgi:hypothetical protein
MQNLEGDRSRIRKRCAPRGCPVMQDNEELHTSTEQVDSGAALGPFQTPEGETYWRLGDPRSLRRVMVRKYRGQVLVDIREYYRDAKTGEELPGRKGISLTMKQFRSLQTLLPDIEVALQQVSRND